MSLSFKFTLFKNQPADFSLRGGSTFFSTDAGPNSPSQRSRVSPRIPERPPSRSGRGVPFPPSKKLLARLREPQAFVDRHYELKPFDFTSPGGPNARPSLPRFRIVNFTEEESAAIR